MLTVAQCREGLDEETSASLSDEEVVRLRDDMYALVRIMLDTEKDAAKPPCQSMN